MGIEVIHLDQLAYEHGTDWIRRTDADFVADHDQEIQKESWVIEGNSGMCMPQRFARSTSVIWLDPSLLGCTLRYILRSIKSDQNRVGKLQGSQREFSLKLLKYTWFNYPRNRIKYNIILSDYTGKLVKVRSMRELNRRIELWKLN